MGRRVEYFRTHRRDGRPKMTAKELAERCAAEGLPLDRAVIAKLEKGIRQTVSVAEVLVLGRALGVPPIELIFPIGHQELYEVLPGKEMGTWQAAKWFSGEDVFLIRAADGEWDSSEEDDRAHQRSAAFAYRWHDRYVKYFLRSDAAAKAERRAAGAAETDAERDAHLRLAAAEDRQHQSDRRQLRQHREQMRREGLTPPQMWGVLADIDDTDPREEAP